MKNCKLLSLLLSVTLLFSLFSTTAFALDETITTVNAQEAKTEDIAVDNLEDYESESIISQELFEDIVNGSAKVDGLQIDDSVTFSTNVSSTDIIASIMDDEFTIEGKVADGENEYDIDDYYDFSSTSKYHIAEWAYLADLISEEEKVDCFCELILDRNFENIDCLEGVFDSIQQYQLNNELPVELNGKINEIFSVPFSNDNDGTTISTRSISNEAEYSSSNFTIHYDSSKTTLAVAKSVADYFEQIRTAYINLGFKTPKLQWFKSTYQVYLDPNSDPDGTAAATTTKSATLTNTCASYITIYNFSSLTLDVQERIAHEYFHAIQNAYNHQSGWFKEACANWGKIIVGGSSTTCDGQIKTFITGATSMPETSGYGAVMYPLTIHRRYGGADAILSIYETYNDYGASISESKLRDVITLGIQDTGTTEGFGAAYRAMASYLYSTPTWYTSVYAGASSWTNAPVTTKNVTETNSSSLYNASTTISGTLNYLTNNYYELSIPAGFKGAVKIVVDYSDSNGKTQVYTKATNGVHTINYNSTDSEGISTFIQSDVGDGISSIAIILTNLAESSSISFNAKIILLPTKSTLSPSTSLRYMERITYIDASEYVEYNITFPTSGYKLIQTFGTTDTKIELYSASGTLLTSNDDGGYSLNSLMKYYCYANTEYIIRVKFWSSSTYGETKLAITPAYGALNSDSSDLTTYEDIYAITTYTGYTWGTYAQKNYARVITYTPPSSGSYTFTIESEFDTYIYVIDPRSSELVKINVNYNDDSGEGMNPLLTTTLDANVPYLIIYSAFNPNSLTETKDLTVKINKN